MQNTRLADWISIFIAVLALTATTYNVAVTRSTARAALFAQFQGEYSAVASQFPERLLDPTFRPPRGSGDYKKLQDYWIFAYAEWFETGRSKPLFVRDLWTDYYAGLIQDATQIPSLRYVLEDMANDDPRKRKDMRKFFDVLRELAKEAGNSLGDAPAPAAAPAK